LLKVTDLYAGYGNLQILNGVSIQAFPGKITVIVGPNGSGKSTLLKSISGIASVSGGTIELDGLLLSKKSPTEVARSGVAYLPQTENVFTNLSVRENLRLAGYTLKEDNSRST
jgi:branched-chain amino acid transport system ATP-binding protein